MCCSVACQQCTQPPRSSWGWCRHGRFPLYWHHLAAWSCGEERISQNWTCGSDGWITSHNFSTFEEREAENYWHIVQQGFLSIASGANPVGQDRASKLSFGGHSDWAVTNCISVAWHIYLLVYLILPRLYLFEAGFNVWQIVRWNLICKTKSDMRERPRIWDHVGYDGTSR